jgi:glycosyltransferase involved in cell wall biosynthesis
MINAASLLQSRLDIKFEFVGTGPELEKMMRLSAELGLKNVQFPGFLTAKDLANKIATADICLGIFGNTQQSFMTIQNKIHECLSMAKPLISGTSPLIARTFRSRENIFLCERNPVSLANAIEEVALSSELRNRISRNGYSIYRALFMPQRIGEVFKKHLEELALSSKKA